jgi:IgGFc binding protein
MLCSAPAAPCSNNRATQLRCVPGANGSPELPRSSSRLAAHALARLTLPLVAMAALACSGSAATSHLPDASTGSQRCSTGVVCGSATTVNMCAGGVVADVLDDCGARGESCSLNRCTSTACATAEGSHKSLLGCRFYAVEAENVRSDAAQTTSFLATNPGGDLATVVLERLAPGDGGMVWTAIATAEVAAGASGRLTETGHAAAGAGVLPQAALRVSSQQPITLAEIVGDDASQTASSSGGTMLLPMQSLGKQHLAVAYPQVPTSDVLAASGSRDGAGRIIVVATRAGTTVELTPFATIAGDAAGTVETLNAGTTYRFSLDDGDVLQLYSNDDGDDWTGTSVAADQPIAVFSGNISTTYGLDAPGINSADMAHEQMPPIQTWSHVYVAASLTPEQSVACTSFFGKAGASLWRVVASEDGTTVSFDGPGASGLQTLQLSAGEAASVVASGSFTVTASSPVLVTQGMDCEPTLSLAVAADDGALIQNLPFAVLPNFDLMLGVVRHTGLEVDLDGVPILDSLFAPAGGDFEVAQLSLQSCDPASGACTHRLTAPTPTSTEMFGFGMTLRGMDVACSYALTAPALIGCDPDFELCLQ